MCARSEGLHRPLFIRSSVLDILLLISSCLASPLFRLRSRILVTTETRLRNDPSLAFFITCHRRSNNILYYPPLVLMNDSTDTDTPPSLYHSPSINENDHLSTRESTPISTPVGFGATSSYARKSSNRRQDLFNWDSTASRDSSSRPLFLDSTLVETDGEDTADVSHLPLFPSSSSGKTNTMNGQQSPFDLSARQTSVSPPGQQASNLTSALQKAANNDRANNSSVPAASNASAVYKAAAARKDSLSANMSQWGNGTKPISVMGSNREKPRRESLAGSLVGGMSWGGVSVGSWIRDESVCLQCSTMPLFNPI